MYICDVDIFVRGGKECTFFNTTQVKLVIKSYCVCVCVCVTFHQSVKFVQIMRW